MTLQYPSFKNCRNNFTYLLEQAAEFNRSLSKIDLSYGTTSPEDSAVSEHISTAISAIEAGLKTGSTKEIFEGLDLLNVCYYRIVQIERDHLLP